MNTKPLPEREPSDEVTQFQSSPPPSQIAMESGVQGLIAGRYELLEKIAEGGMGIVYRATDRTLMRDVAIKLTKQFQPSDNAVRRFMEESRISGQLQHPGIPPIHDLGTLPDGRPFLAMKLIKGRTLADMLAQRQGLEYLTFMSIFQQICQAMAYAHSRSVIHRDLKPSNVMIGAFGEVQVMDWGLARVMDQQSIQMEGHPESTRDNVSHIHDPRTGAGSETLTGFLIGTAAYFPPEQASGEKSLIDQRSDVFGLGAILCVILTGEPPYTGPHLEMQAKRGKLDDCWQRLDACGAEGEFIMMVAELKDGKMVGSRGYRGPGPELVALCKRCLDPEPSKRPADAGDVAQSVAACLSNSIGAAQQAEADRRRAESERQKAELQVVEEHKRSVLERKKHKWQLGAAAAVFLLALVAGNGAWRSANQRAKASLHRQQADGKALFVIDQGRTMLRKAWKTDAENDLLEAKAEARAAVGIAAGGSEYMQNEAAALKREVDARIEQSEKNHELRDALFDVVSPLEMASYKSDEKGQMMAIIQPSAEEQFALAFRHWGVDLDRVPIKEAYEKLAAQREPVVQEIVAGLDEWCLDRRRHYRPEAEWQRLNDLANELDRNEGRKEIRRMRVSDALLAERAATEIAGGFCPWTALADLPVGRNTRRLCELADAVDGVNEPALELVLLSQALELAGDNKRADTVLRAGLDAHPESVVLLDSMAKLLERQNPPQLVKAIECYQALRALRPMTGVSLSAALAAAERLTAGEEVLRDLLRRQPRNPELRLYHGNILEDLKKPEEAVAEYELAINLKSNYAEAWNNLGFTLSNMRRLDEAISAYRRALEIKPDLALTHLNLGIALGYKGAFNDSVAEISKAIDLGLGTAAAYNNLGNALRGQNELVKAVAAYRKATEINPNYGLAYFNLGIILRLQKNLPDAVAAFQKASELRPDDLAAQQELAKTQRWMQWEARLPALVTGKETLNDPAEHLEFALFCAKYKFFFHASARFFADAFAANQKLAEDSNNGYRYGYYAAWCAALAAAGQGFDAANLKQAERDRLRNQVLDWLRAELSAEAKLIDAGKPEARAFLRQRLEEWQQDSAFAGVRDATALAKLPDPERESWRKLWADVEALRKKASDPAK